LLKRLGIHMADINTLEIGTELDNADLQAIFKCS